MLMVLTGQDMYRFSTAFEVNGTPGWNFRFSFPLVLQFQKSDIVFGPV